MNMEWLYISQELDTSYINKDGFYKESFFIEIHYSISNKFLIVITKPLLLN